jgi:hypothetical protein
MDAHPGAQWPQFLRPAATALNVMYNLGIHNTPHYMVYLSYFRFPFLNYIVEADREPINNYNNYLQVQKRRLYQAYDQAQLPEKAG